MLLTKVRRTPNKLLCILMQRFLYEKTMELEDYLTKNKINAQRTINEKVRHAF